MDIEPRLAELERAARSLEIDTGTRAAQLAKVSAYAERFLDRVETDPVYMFDRDDDEAFSALTPREEPGNLDDALELIRRHVDGSGVHIGSPRFFAFIPSGGLYTSALGDFLAAATNRYAGTRFSGPGATRLDRLVVRWFADQFGYPAEAEGDLTSGGSVAGLSAIVAAREAQGLKSADFARAVVYTSAMTHHSLAKALRIAGLGECTVRDVPLDAGFRIHPIALERLIKQDRAAGSKPWLIVATAGTTDLGAVDPLGAIADLAASHELWCHVDAAYGGAFVLSPSGRERLAGIERSDSLVVDPHKGLFLPFGSGLVLVRDGRKLIDAFYARAPYLQDFTAVFPQNDLSAADLSPELSRPFRGLRVWLPLRLFGVAPFRAALEEKLLLARYFHQRMEVLPGFEVGPAPDLSIAAFRYVPARGDANEFNRRLCDDLRADGRIFLSSTTVRGNYLLRFAVLNYNTHRDDVEFAMDVIFHTVERLRAQ
jgi:glutamate/tyrosine decarboxylase-like PLP-dependent enzyme